MTYPWIHFWRHPILVSLVTIDYALRRMGLKPDKSYWADMKLLDKTWRIQAMKGKR